MFLPAELPQPQEQPQYHQDWVRLGRCCTTELHHWQLLRNQTQVKLLQKKPQDKTLVQTDSKIFSFGKSRLAAQHGHRTREAVRQGRYFLTQARGGLWNSTSIPSWGEKPDQRHSNCSFWRWLIEARFPVAPIYFLWSFKYISAHLPGEQSWGV